MSADTQSRVSWNPNTAGACKSGGILSLFRFRTHADERRQGDEAESKLLADVNSAGSISSKVIDIDIDSDGNYIHTLVISKNDSEASAEPAGDKGKRSLVMTHGYFTGIGFYYRNYRSLSEVDGWNIYSIDWLGMGRSSRPVYTSDKAKSEEARVASAEAFFVESLEEWRKRVGIERMTLCGHSFGGYMSALYALRYPEHVEKLILVSPIGVPEAPPDYEERLRSGRPLRDRPSASPTSNARKSKQSKRDASDASETKEPEQPSIKQKMLLRTALSLWERNFAPQWLIRTAGPLGQRLINWYVSRFTWLSEKEQRDLAAYTHHISTLPGSSEYALGDILKPGAFARRPLVSRLSGMAVPTVFMYGANDWVDHKGGEAAIKQMSASNSALKHRLYKIPKAGHNIHLENPEDFNQVLIQEMRDTSR
ncbi:hypothetical protein GGI12_000390 [Dipsacomyces acuminosporus]|nr:hypothetical protein GGI12_000390 [Dipsacomyces acuminosporus]